METFVLLKLLQSCHVSLNLENRIKQRKEEEEKREGQALNFSIWTGGEEEKLTLGDDVVCLFSFFSIWALRMKRERERYFLVLGPSSTALPCSVDNRRTCRFEKNRKRRNDRTNKRMLVRRKRNLFSSLVFGFSPSISLMVRITMTIAFRLVLGTHLHTLPLCSCLAFPSDYLTEIPSIIRLRRLVIEDHQLILFVPKEKNNIEWTNSMLEAETQEEKKIFSFSSRLLIDEQIFLLLLLHRWWLNRSHAVSNDDRSSLTNRWWIDKRSKERFSEKEIKNDRRHFVVCQALYQRSSRHHFAHSTDLLFELILMEQRFSIHDGFDQLVMMIIIIVKWDRSEEFSRLQIIETKRLMSWEEDQGKEQCVIMKAKWEGDQVSFKVCSGTERHVLPPSSPLQRSMPCVC